jgi:hypothetical protein
MSQASQAIQRLGDLSHVVIDGNHGSWTVTVLWGGFGPYVGNGDCLDCAYRSALDKLIVSGHSVPGIHDLAAQVTPGLFENDDTSGQ